MSRETDTACCGSAQALTPQAEGPDSGVPDAPCCAPAEPAKASTAGPVPETADRPCCEPAPQPCRSAEVGRERAGYRILPFVEGWIDTPAGPVPRVRTRLDAGDLLGRWQMRWGIGRERYRIAPGLYAVGSPRGDSPVLVTANYKMTFDVLRRDVAGLDAWILVLETHGINVWCAAGKGTFDTAEVVRRVKATGLERVVNHRDLVLPQLGAAGVSAHQVRKGCGFSVAYGPVRARDIRPFLAAGRKATAEMRRVTFSALERLALTPVELVLALKPAAWTALALFVVGGIGPSLFSFSEAWHRGLGALQLMVAGLVAGAVATPVLLPWLPWRAFSAKGALVGGAVAAWAILRSWDSLAGLEALALALALPAASSYVAMNFTGATPFTSPSGVEKEMRRAIPWQALALGVAAVAWIASAFAA